MAMSKKQAKEIAILINRIQVWTAARWNGSTLSAEDIMKSTKYIAECEVELADKHGIILPAVDMSRDILKNYA